MAPDGGGECMADWRRSQGRVCPAVAGRNRLSRPAQDRALISRWFPPAAARLDPTRPRRDLSGGVFFGPSLSRRQRRPRPRPPDRKRFRRRPRDNKRPSPRPPIVASRTALSRVTLRARPSLTAVFVAALVVSSEAKIFELQFFIFRVHHDLAAAL